MMIEQHPMEVARHALIDAAWAEGGKLGAALMRVAIQLPSRGDVEARLRPPEYGPRVAGEVLRLVDRRSRA